MEISLKLNKNVYLKKDYISFCAGIAMIGHMIPTGKKYVFDWLWYDVSMPAAFRNLGPKVKKSVIKQLEAEYLSKVSLLKEHNLTSVSWRADIEF